MVTAPGQPLRVLVAHNAYQHRGGEDSVMEAEVELLRRHGHEVEVYLRHNDELARMGTASAALQALHSRRTLDEMAGLMDRFRPDVVHVHNTVPLISPSIYWAADKAGVPVVQTLHNFRLLCPQALLLRDGRVCEDCVGHVPWRGVMHGCYRGSRAQSAVIALSVTAHRVAGTWDRKVARYVALNEFARRKFIAGGLPAERIAVKPNFIDLPAPDEGPREGLLFVGRLSPEKGLDTLLAAMDLLPSTVRLQVAGSGPLEALVRSHPSVEYLGALNAEQVYARMRSSSLLLVPSIWYENFPRTIVEAYACGLPVIASKLGALTDLVDDEATGRLLPVGDPAAWAACIGELLAQQERLGDLGRQARSRYEREMTGATNYQQLIAIYDDARRTLGSASA